MGTEMRLVGRGLEFPEGPIALWPTAGCWWSRSRRGTLATVAPDGTVTRVATVGGGPNGAAVGPGRQGLRLQQRRLRVERVRRHRRPRAAARRLHRRAHPARRHRHRRVRGRLHRGRRPPAAGAQRHRVRRPRAASTSPTSASPGPATSDKAGVYYATTDGSSITEIVYGLDHANGIALSPDGRQLYVAETITGRLWTWDDRVARRAGGRRRRRGPGTLLYSFEGYQLLDSMAVDSDGNICVATLITGAVSVVSPDGRAARPVHGARVRRLRDEHLLRRPRPDARPTSRRRAAACCTR